MWKFLFTGKPAKVSDGDYKEYEAMKQKAAEFLEANPVRQSIGRRPCYH